MIMAKEPLKLIFTDLVSALSTKIDPELIYLGNRPNITEGSTMTKFVMVSLPASIEDIAIGRKKFVLDTTGVFYLFQKAKKDTTLNLNATSSFVSDIEGLFPIRGEVCGASDPTVLMRGADENGFQVITITFSLQTRANVFSED